MAVERARALRPKSSTVSEMLAELCYARWIFLRSNRLPLEAQHLIRSFLLSPTQEMAGRRIVGLHNGHDFDFHSMASLPAGKLMCQVGKDGDGCVDKVWSLADYCTSQGCPVSEEAPVALATRALYDDETLIPLPAEFAALVPGDASPAESVFDDMESADGWFEDIELFEEEDSGDSEQDQEHEEWPARRQGKIPRDPERHVRQGGEKRACAPQLPQDVELRHQLESGDVVRQNDGRSWSHKIRDLLRQGANPIHCMTHAESKELSTFEKVGKAKASMQTHLDDLRAGRLCRHQAHFSYRYASNFEAIKKSARNFMDHLGSFDEVLELLAAVVKVWERAAPAPAMCCSKDCLHGRGVLRPDAACLLQALHATPCAENSDETEILALADRIWNMQQTWKASPRQLCCCKAEEEAMLEEDQRARQQRKKDLERRTQAERQRKRAERAALAEEQLHQRLCSSELKNGTGPRCNLCGVRGEHLFSNTQLRKGYRKRCRQCMEAQQLGVVERHM